MDQTNISQRIPPRLAHPLCLCLLFFGLGSCGGEEATETGRACASSNLIDQCPVGSTPEVTGRRYEQLFRTGKRLGCGTKRRSGRWLPRRW